MPDCLPAIVPTHTQYDNTKKTRPILPDMVLSCDPIAKARAHELSPHAANISKRTQP